jgi:hypothetical protein
MNEYGISTTAGVKVILPILGQQSLVCINSVHHYKVRLVFWEGEVTLALKECHVTSLWTPQNSLRIYKYPLLTNLHAFLRLYN